METPICRLLLRGSPPRGRKKLKCDNLEDEMFCARRAWRHPSRSAASPLRPGLRGAASLYPPLGRRIAAAIIPHVLE